MRCLLVLQSHSKRRRRRNKNKGEEEGDEKKKEKKKRRKKEIKTQLQQDVFTCSLVSRPVYISSHLLHILHLALSVLQESYEASRQR